MIVSNENLLEVLDIYAAALRASTKKSIEPQIYDPTHWPSWDDRCAHMLWMMEQIRSFVHMGNLDDKAMRWLCFIQGTMWNRGILAISDAIDHNSSILKTSWDKRNKPLPQPDDDQKNPSFESDPTALVAFCVRCFASSDDSSWGEVLLKEYCMNCGCNGPHLEIPRYDVKEIRRNASWVGKRYYPAEEDRKNREELERLRSEMTSYPGRSVSPADGEGWLVKQEKPDGTWISMYVDANSPNDALEKLRIKLPFYKESDLKK